GSADSVLDAKIDQEVQDRTSEDVRVLSEGQAYVDQEVSAEAADRIAGDAALQTGLDQEILDRILDVDTEESDRKADVDAEESDRKADVDAEESDRIQDVDAEESDRIQDVDIEESARISGDDALEALILAEIAALSQYVDAALSALADYVDSQDADLQMQIDANANDIDNLAIITDDHENRLLDLESPERHGRLNQFLPGNYTFTVPVGVNRVWISAVGAGGGAASRGEGLPIFNGGDGASYFQYEVDVIPGQIIDFSVGVGGDSVVGLGVLADNGDSTKVDWDGDPLNGANLVADGGNGAETGSLYGGSNGADSTPIFGPALRWSGSGSSDASLPGGDGMVRIEW
ncbi:MAG TPA: hypothetical protein QGG59_07995, partial [Planctomycetota bacterium]|nr:hypothetical protein [Planctomycetota bacterium]